MSFLSFPFPCFMFRFPHLFELFSFFFFFAFHFFLLTKDLFHMPDPTTFKPVLLFEDSAEREDHGISRPSYYL